MRFFFKDLSLHHQWGRPAHVPWTEDFSHLLQYQHSLLGVVRQKGPGECGSQHLPGSLSSSRFAKNFQHFPLFVKVFTVSTFLGWETISATLGWASQGWDFVIKAVSRFSILIDTLASYHGHVAEFQGYQQVKPIKLTTCSEGEFTCNDGQCISIEQRFLVSLFVVKNDQRWKWQIWQMFLWNLSHLVLFLLSYRFTKKEKCEQCYDHGFISTRLYRCMIQSHAVSIIDNHHKIS